MNKTKRLDTRISLKEYRATVKSAKACDLGLCEYVREAVRRLNGHVELWAAAKTMKQETKGQT